MIAQKTIDAKRPKIPRRVLVAAANPITTTARTFGFPHNYSGVWLPLFRCTTSQFLKAFSCDRAFLARAHPQYRNGLAIIQPLVKFVRLRPVRRRSVNHVSSNKAHPDNSRWPFENRSEERR